MIEVFARGNGFSWRMIDALGRALVYVEDNWPTDFEAFAAAKAYRAAAQAVAAMVDHRMGACI